MKPLVLATALLAIGCAHGNVRKDVKDVASVNGTKLYYEIHGAGPTLLLISGATGDAGHFDKVAQLLSDKFTVVTYDRRGNSRSARPDGWTKTSIPEQADDAAALIKALGLAPVAVYSTSAGAQIGLDLAIRYPQLLRGVVLHEPPMLSVLSHPEQVMPSIMGVIQKGMQAKGPPGGIEAFLRMVAGDAAYDAIDPAVKDRMLKNADVCFNIEFQAFGGYRPTDEQLAAIKPPVRLVLSTNTTPFFTEIGQWLGTRLKLEVGKMPGGHAAYFDHPQELADAIRPMIESFK